MKRERPTTRSAWTRASVLAALLVLTGMAVSDEGWARSRGLEGYWRGGGSVAFATGQRERAQCRAQYRRAARTSYVLTATCAIPSGRATQTATLRWVGGNTYRGHFYNSEYNVSGTILVTVGGNHQSVRLTSESGTASFELHR